MVALFWLRRGHGDSWLTLALGSNLRGESPPSLGRNLRFLCSLPTGTVLELGKFHLPVGEPVELGEGKPSENNMFFSG